MSDGAGSFIFNDAEGKIHFSLKLWRETFGVRLSCLLSEGLESVNSVHGPLLQRAACALEEISGG